MLDFPGGLVVKNPPSSMGDTGSIEDWETEIPRATRKLVPQLRRINKYKKNFYSFFMFTVFKSFTHMVSYHLIITLFPSYSVLPLPTSLSPLVTATFLSIFLCLFFFSIFTFVLL